jgi:hypothetical protein
VRTGTGSQKRGLQKLLINQGTLLRVGSALTGAFLYYSVSPIYLSNCLYCIQPPKWVISFASARA